ncbi:MAG: carboxypeptidase regulatory-like domain-containing protein, partial [Terriglobia bacterium]
MRRDATAPAARVYAPILLLFAALVALVAPRQLCGQSTALLTGTVVDPSGAVVPQARVTCRNAQTGLSHVMETGPAGLFRFPDLPIGVYDVTASHAGFATQTRRGITLVTGHSVDIRIELQVGHAAQTVQVTAGAQEVQPTSSELQTSVESQSMRDMPLNGRNPLQLVFLTTGAINMNGQNGGSLSFQTANTQVAVNGNRGTDNGYELDGVNYTDVHFGTAPVLPDPDALQEFTVKSSNFSASQSGAGASVQFSTRSGTNDFHGSAFEFLRNDTLDARNFFASAPTPFKRNQYGGTFGGPIIKDKTFFFASYQGTRVVGGASPSVATPPPATYRQGNFAGGPVIVDPATGKTFPGNTIPSDRIDPLAATLLPYMPLPNQPNGTFQSNPRTNQNDDQALLRIDHNLSSRDHLTGRYFFDKFDFQEATSPFPDFYGTDTYTNQSLMVSDTHTFSPNLLLVGTFGYTRVPRVRAAVEPTTMQALGANVPLASSNAPPQISTSISGYANLVSGTPIQIQPHTFEYRAHFTWSHDKHMVQFGMDVIRNDEYAFDRSRESGTWSFDGSRTASAAVPKSGNAMADFLLGLPQLFSQHGASPQSIYETKWQPWIQDDWRVLPRLTLNLGVRWEPWLPANDRLAPQVGFEAGVHSTVAPNAPTGLVFSGDPGLQHSVFRNDWNNVAPRVGFAWDVEGNAKTIVRGAYGIFYRPSPLNLQRFSGNIATFRGLTINISDPPSFASPYLGYAGGAPFPWTPPTASQLQTYPFTPPVATAALAPDSRTSYVQEWNFTVERQVTQSLGVTLAYVGNHMVKGMSSTEGNPGVYGPGATEANVNSRRPLAGIGSLQLLSPFEFSNYN